MAGDVIRHEDDLVNALYGDDAVGYNFGNDGMTHHPVRLDNGLFRERRFSSLSGVILYKGASFMDKCTSGWSYINPMHFRYALNQPGVFSTMNYCALREWQNQNEG